jgi:hypothetical protein
MLFTFFMLAGFIFFAEPLLKYLEGKWSWLAIADVTVDEDMDSYWKCLDEEDVNWIMKEEENCRKLGMPMMVDSSMNEFRWATNSHGHAKRTIQGVHSYDILANPLYKGQFQYVDCDEPNREKFIIDGDDDESNDTL